MALELFYTFNEGTASTIRDYSTNGIDGTGTLITNQTSTEVGKEIVFNAGLDRLAIDSSQFSTITPTDLSIHFTINLQSTTGTLKVFTCGSLDVTWDGATLTASVTDEGAGTSTVSQALNTGQYYDILLVKDGSTFWRMYIDSGLGDQDSGFSSGGADLGTTFYVGNNTVTNSANFILQELKIFTDLLSAKNIISLYNNNNGVLVTNSVQHNYVLGDIIGNIDAAQYAVVTYIDGTTTFRIHPLTTSINIGLPMHKVGHVWDTDKDHYIYLTEDGIYFYDSINTTAEVLNSANLLWSLTEDGIILKSTTKTANYTAENKDNIIKVDSSGGAFTITLPATPTTDKVITIIDSVGSCGTYTVTVDGNGNNINGEADSVLTDNYEAHDYIYNGTQWNIK